MATHRHALLIALPLLAGCQFNPVIETECLPDAAALGDVDFARTYLDRGVSPNTYDCDGNTPLHLAARNDQPAAVTLLVDRGANVNALNDAGQTPLHLAAAFDNSEAVQFLLDHKADASALDNLGNTPLHDAAMRNLASNAYLLDAGASPATRNLAGQTPFDLAVAHNSAAVIELFRKHGVQE